MHIVSNAQWHFIVAFLHDEIDHHHSHTCCCCFGYDVDSTHASYFLVLVLFVFFSLGLFFPLFLFKRTSAYSKTPTKYALSTKSLLLILCVILKFGHFFFFFSFQFPCLNILFLKIFILLPDLIFLPSFTLILFLYKHLVPTISIGVIPRDSYTEACIHLHSPSIYCTLILLVLYNVSDHRRRCCLFRLWLRLWLIRDQSVRNIQYYSY